MPAAPCPRTVQMYVYFLPFLSVTTSVALLLWPSSFVFLPAILKSCWIEPLFVTLNDTLPCGALLRESLNENSFAVTETDVVCALRDPAYATTEKTLTAARAATPASKTMRFMRLLTLVDPASEEVTYDASS